MTFIPHSIPIPTVSRKDYLIQAVDDIVSILNSPSNALLPTLKEGDVTRNSFLEIATAFKTALPPPTLLEKIVPEPRVDVQNTKETE